MVVPVRLLSFSELSSLKRGPRLRSLIEIGVFGLDAMAWELASGRGGIATPAFDFHREGGLALNGTTGARLE